MGALVVRLKKGQNQIRMAVRDQNGKNRVLLIRPGFEYPLPLNESDLMANGQVHAGIAYRNIPDAEPIDIDEIDVNVVDNHRLFVIAPLKAKMKMVIDKHYGAGQFDMFNARAESQSPGSGLSSVIKLYNAVSEEKIDENISMYPKLPDGVGVIGSMSVEKPAMILDTETKNEQEIMDSKTCAKCGKQFESVPALGKHTKKYHSKSRKTKDREIAFEEAGN